MTSHEALQACLLLVLLSQDVVSQCHLLDRESATTACGSCRPGFYTESPDTKVLLGRRSALYNYDPTEYSVNDDDLAWVQPGFDDSSWQQDLLSPVGMDCGPVTIASEIEIVPSKQVYRFRSSFEVTDLGAIDSLSIKAYYDDGFIMYINGQNVTRGNMEYGSEASIVRHDASLETFNASASMLQVGTNVVAVSVHQSHTLSTDIVAEFEISGVQASDSTVLLGFGSFYSYDPSEVSVKDDDFSWIQPGFDDSSWVHGLAAPVGYNCESFIATRIVVEDGKYVYRFRTTFEVADPSTVEAVLIEARYDDGFRLFLNGEYALRVNVDIGSNAANGGHEAAFDEYFWISADQLVAGTNVAAVALHQVTYSSSDIVLDLGLRAVLNIHNASDQSACLPCSHCGGDVPFTSKACTPFHDTICSECSATCPDVQYVATCAQTHTCAACTEQDGCALSDASASCVDGNKLACTIPHDGFYIDHGVILSCTEQGQGCEVHGSTCSTRLGFTRVLSCLAPSAFWTLDGDVAVAPLFCSDGVQNHQETGVDCGGYCPRCGCERRQMQRCFRRTNESVPYAELRTICREWGGTLAILDSPDVHTVVYELADSELVYIGLTDHKNTNAFSWDDGSTSDDRMWGPDQPDDFGGSEECVRIFADGLMYDTPCENPGYGICEESIAAYCTDGIRNGDEEEPDCGGSCAPCTRAPSCDDGIRNGGEYLVDCGGGCPACTLACPSGCRLCTDGATCEACEDSLVLTASARCAAQCPAGEASDPAAPASPVSPCIVVGATTGGESASSGVTTGGEEEEGLVGNGDGGDDGAESSVAVIVAAVVSSVCCLLVTGAAAFVLATRSQTRKSTQLQMDSFMLSGDDDDSTVVFSKGKNLTGFMKAVVSSKQPFAKGGFGSVYDVQMPDGTPAALKVLDAQKSVLGEREFYRELAVLTRFHEMPDGGRYVVDLLCFCPEADFTAIGMPFAEGGSLKEYCQKEQLPFEQIKDIALRCAACISHVHKGGVFHGDIKPSNFLIMSRSFRTDSIVICDFGTSSDVNSEGIAETLSASATPQFVAPERYAQSLLPEKDGHVFLQKLDVRKADVFSFGIMMWSLVCQCKTPFSSVPAAEVPSKYQNGFRPDFSESTVAVARFYRDLAELCFSHDPASRPLFPAIVQTFQAEELPSMPAHPLGSQASDVTLQSGAGR